MSKYQYRTIDLVRQLFITGLSDQATDRKVEFIHVEQFDYAHFLY